MSRRCIADLKAFLLDFDGTFVLGNHLLPGAAELFDILRKREIPFLFLTNNSSASAFEYQAKLDRLGFKVRKDQILTSGDATLIYLRDATSYRSVYLLGTPSLEEDFTSAGFILTDDNPDCVVIGYDKTITYEKMAKASILLASGIPYFATHPDYTCITAEGLIPDTGAFVVALEKVTGRVPKYIGKPMPEMANAALARLGANAHETAMIGDQLDTDIKMAQSSGLFGVLVLSGETSKERYEAQSEIVADMVLPNVSGLLRELSS